MGDRLEVRINVIWSIQEKFRHDIREMKKELARLAKLVENRAETRVVHSRESSYANPQPCFLSTNNILLGTHLRLLLPILAMMPTFVATPQSVN